jgi:hypothetical protein
VKLTATEEEKHEVLAFNFSLLPLLNFSFVGDD